MAGSSIASNNWRRLIPSRRISHAFIRSTASVMAALHSAREKNVTLRSRPMMYDCANLTPASTAALETVVNCRLCRHDLPEVTHHPPIPSAGGSRI
jgi:hypothetical protein